MANDKYYQCEKIEETKTQPKIEFTPGYIFIYVLTTLGTLYLYYYVYNHMGFVIENFQMVMFIFIIIYSIIGFCIAYEYIKNSPKKEAFKNKKKKKPINLPPTNQKISETVIGKNDKNIDFTLFYWICYLMMAVSLLFLFILLNWVYKDDNDKTKSVFSWFLVKRNVNP